MPPQTPTLLKTKQEHEWKCHDICHGSDDASPVSLFIFLLSSKSTKSVPQIFLPSSSKILSLRNFFFPSFWFSISFSFFFSFSLMSCKNSLDNFPYSSLIRCLHSQETLNMGKQRIVTSNKYVCCLKSNNFQKLRKLQAKMIRRETVGRENVDCKLVIL